MVKNLLCFIIFLLIGLNLNDLNAGDNNSVIRNTEYLILTDGKLEDIEVQIYPNPLINNQLNIESNKEFIFIEVLDIVGKKIFFEEFSSPVSRKVIDLSGYDKGLYLIRIKFDNKKVYTEKIVIR